MNRKFEILAVAALMLGGVAYGRSQSTQQTPPPAQNQGTSAGSDIGHGVGDAAGDSAKGVGTAAGGVGKGAADVVTLHPVAGAESASKGGVKGGYDVGKGAVKGTGKVAEGTGKVVTKPFRHGKKKDKDEDPQ